MADSETTRSAKDWTLLVVSEAGATPLQPVQLQKALFLVSRNVTPASLGTPSFYAFEPYDYGPFCSAIYADAAILEAEGLLSIRRPPAVPFNLFQATSNGMQRAEALRLSLGPGVSDYLRRVVQFTMTRSFNDLVRSIYQAYPDMKANSVFQDFQ